MPRKGSEPLLNVQEAAERLRTTPGVIYKWRYQGRGPRSFKVGNSVRFRESAINEYLTSREKATGRGEVA
ncbi:MAG: helix-turn-helix domain-containing protein [Umezawaea sp.]